MKMKELPTGKKSNAAKMEFKKGKSKTGQST